MKRQRAALRLHQAQNPIAGQVLFNAALPMRRMGQERMNCRRFYLEKDCAVSSKDISIRDPTPHFHALMTSQHSGTEQRRETWLGADDGGN